MAPWLVVTSIHVLERSPVALEDQAWLCLHCSPAAAARQPSCFVCTACSKPWSLLVFLHGWEDCCGVFSCWAACHFWCCGPSALI